MPSARLSKEGVPTRRAYSRYASATARHTSLAGYVLWSTGHLPGKAKDCPSHFSRTNYPGPISVGLPLPTHQIRGAWQIRRHSCPKCARVQDADRWHLFPRLRSIAGLCCRSFYDRVCMAGLRWEAVADQPCTRQLLQWTLQLCIRSQPLRMLPNSLLAHVHCDLVVVCDTPRM